MRSCIYIFGTMVVLLALQPTDAPATTFHVPDDYATIQGAVDATSPGDTVLVAPGTYGEGTVRLSQFAIAHLSHAIVLRSSGGASVTTLDASMGIGVRNQGVLGTEVEQGTVEIHGFTFTGIAHGSTAILAHSTSIRIVVQDCVFRLVEGAGIWVFGGGQIRRCLFDRCQSAVAVGGDEATVEDCRFVECSGFGLRLGTLTSIVRKCDFEWTIGTALGIYRTRDAIEEAIVQECSFVRNLSGWYAPIEIARATRVTIGANEFFENSAGLGSIHALDCASLTFEGNTLVGNSSRFAAAAGSLFGEAVDSALIRNNIFARSFNAPALRVSNIHPDSGCNAFWGNWNGDFVAYEARDTDVFEDPLFCDERRGDFQLAKGSPCLPEGSNGCGQIGAYGMNCEPVSLNAASWGAIKSLYR